MQRIFIIVLGVVAALLITACNANSDAVHVVETQNISLQATIASYGNMGATVTAQATLMAQKLATAQIALTAVNSQVKDLTSKMNAGAAQSVVVSSALSTNSTTPGPNDAPAAGQSETAANTGTALSFATVVTAKTKDSAGCAVSPTSTFNDTDPSILIIADVRNFKKGTVFTAKWAGDSFNREDNWTTTSDGVQMCIHFYIEPKTLALQAGNYTVTMSAGDVTAQPVQFTVQSPNAPAGGAGATPSQAPS